MKKKRSENIQLASGLFLAGIDSLRYVTTQTLWIRLAGKKIGQQAAMDEAAAIFGRWQGLVYMSVFGCLFFVPHKVIVEDGKSKNKTHEAFDYETLIQSQILFLLAGGALSTFFGLGSSSVLKVFGIDATATTAKIAQGFAIGGVFHAFNFANQNAFYAARLSRVSITANTLAFVVTTLGNALTYFFLSSDRQPFCFGLSLSLGELIKPLVYIPAYLYLNGGNLRVLSCCKPSNVLRVWKGYIPGIPTNINFILDLLTELLMVWRVVSVAGPKAVDVLNLAMPLNSLFMLFAMEVSQSQQKFIQRAFYKHNTKVLMRIYWKLFRASLLMPFLYIIGAVLSPFLGYYGFSAKECLIGLGSMSVLNVFHSNGFVMRQQMLSDKIVRFPAIYSILLLWMAFGASFVPGVNNFLGIMLARTAAYVVSDLTFALGCMDWIKRGPQSFIKRAENLLSIEGSSLSAAGRILGKIKSGWSRYNFFAHIDPPNSVASEVESKMIVYEV
ncbi:MAG: hypothetical protein KAS93_01960 [Gammaproteobacteria bacterium]|nr:hypothetical protein [Gammaproteobacteria bacterium]